MDETRAKFSVIRLVIYFSLVAFVSLRKVIYCVVDIFICYFLHKVSNYF